MDSTSVSKLEFAWHSLTDNQKHRINMMYELKRCLDKKGEGETKRSVYRLIAERFPGYSVETIEYISNHQLTSNFEKDFKDEIELATRLTNSISDKDIIDEE
jgi:hypothetical protein